MAGIFMGIVGGLVGQLAGRGVRELGEALGSPVVGAVAGAVTRVVVGQAAAADRNAETECACPSAIPPTSTGGPLQRSGVFEALFGPDAGC
jgi:hypothetical protein